MLNGFEIVHETDDHDIIMGSGRNDEKFLLPGSKMLIDIFRIFKRDKAILFTMNDQGGEEYLFDPLQTSLINLFKSHPLSRYSKMKHDPHHTGKTTLNEESLDLFLMVIGQLQGGDTSQRPSHHPQVFSQVSSGKLLSDFFEDGMGILNQIGEGRGPRAGSITPVISNDQVNLLLMIKRRHLIIITYHLTIPMEKKNPRPFAMPHVKAAGDGDTLPNPYGVVEGIFRAGSEILTGIKNKL
jgi:hypothetical protein